jgi:thymidine kinase
MSLEIIIGPMFSGKTSKLLEVYKQCAFCNIPVAVVNHASDTRYHAELLTSHDGRAIPCVRTDRLADVWPGLDAEVILINEAQFFDDLFPATLDMLRCGKKVFVAGLDGDFERKKFGAVLDLIPMCDKVTKLTSLCSVCRDGTPAIFSKRLTDEKGQVVVGVDNYIPVCRSCY